MPSEQREQSHPLTLIRKTELAKLLACSPWSLQRWIRNGKIPRPFYLVDGGPAHWRVKDIEDFLEQRRRSRKPRPQYQGIVAEQMSRAQTQTDAPVRRRRRKAIDAS
jgi:predicted DNA-binding transcriptional regulator AlpA